MFYLCLFVCIVIFREGGFWFPLLEGCFCNRGTGSLEISYCVFMTRLENHTVTLETLSPKTMKKGSIFEKGFLGPPIKFGIWFLRFCGCEWLYTRCEKCQTFFCTDLPVFLEWADHRRISYYFGFFSDVYVTDPCPLGIPPTVCNIDHTFATSSLFCKYLILWARQWLIVSARVAWWWMRTNFFWTKSQTTDECLGQVA